MIIDDVEYVPIQKGQGHLKIAVLQRGWVMIGYYERKENNNCFLYNASVVRVWGTTNGIGEIALNGPTANTKLDKCGTVQFDFLTIVALIDCDELKWNAQ